MDEWTFQMELPLEVQLSTPVTLVMYCLVHRHVFVELMETGHLATEPACNGMLIFLLTHNRVFTTQLDMHAVV